MRLVFSWGFRIRVFEFMRFSFHFWWVCLKNEEDKLLCVTVGCNMVFVVWCEGGCSVATGEDNDDTNRELFIFFSSNKILIKWIVFEFFFYGFYFSSLIVQFKMI